MYKFEKDVYNEKLKECVAGYESYRKMLNEPVDFTDPNALIERLNNINQQNASIPHLKSSFDFLLERAVCIEMGKIDHEAMPAKKFDAIVKDSVAFVSIYVRSLEMMIKESHYMIESIRSVLSYLKKELENINS
jgi:hypothetical protein